MPHQLENNSKKRWISRGSMFQRIILRFLSWGTFPDVVILFLKKISLTDCIYPKRNLVIRTLPLSLRALGQEYSMCHPFLGTSSLSGSWTGCERMLSAAAIGRRFLLPSPDVIPTTRIGHAKRDWDGSGGLSSLSLQSSCQCVILCHYF